MKLRPRRALAAFSAVWGIGCVHLPVPNAGAAPVGPQPSDGITVSVPLAMDAAIDTTVSVLRSRGYTVQNLRGNRQTIRTAPRFVGSDTGLMITAELVPVDVPTIATVIALSATITVPSLGIRDAQVQHVAGTPDGIWIRLREVEEVLRRIRR
ncbi:MAG: hypothetical protein ABJE47_06190 [bacterium]